MDEQTPQDAAYEAQALTEEIAAMTEDIQRLVAQREVLVKRLEQLARGLDVPQVPLRLVPGKDAESASNGELSCTGACA
ncbi:MAG TPA: hypothetical protein VF600_13455 [Abditibacteriaceae bacterium]|jgi:hypothetical protein